MDSRPEPEAFRPGIEPLEVEVVLLTNGVSWYLRSRLVLGRQSLRVTTPRTILGLVPIGYGRYGIELTRVDDVTIGTKLNPDRMLVAAVLAIAAVFGGFGPLGTVLCTVGAIAFLLLGFIAVVRIEEQNRPVRTVPVCLAHLPRARRFIAEVELRSMAAHHRAAGGGGP